MVLLWGVGGSMQVHVGLIKKHPIRKKGFLSCHVNTGHSDRTTRDGGIGRTACRSSEWTSEFHVIMHFTGLHG